MIVTRKPDPDERHARLVIAIDRAAWEAALQSVYLRACKNYPVAGFAAGEVPRAELEKAYGDDFLYQEAVNETFPAALVEAVTRQGLRLAGTPELTVLSIGAEGYTFSADCELYPPVKIGAYRGLSAPMEQVEITDEDGERAVAEFLRAHSKEIPVAGKCAMGDTAVIDFEGFTDGKPFDGGKGEKYELALGSGTFIPGFEEQVFGMAAGEEREIAVTFPQDYVPPLAGKDAVFRVLLHGAHRTETPELTDAFASDLGYADVGALRQKVLLDLVNEKRQDAQDAWEDALVQKVIATLECDIPESMIQSQTDGLMQEIEAQLQSQQIDMDMYLKARDLTMDALRAQIRPNALEAVRYELTMEEIAREENFTVAPEELTARYAELSKVYGMTEEALRGQIPPDVLTHDLRSARARAVIISSAKRA